MGSGGTGTSESRSVSSSRVSPGSGQPLCFELSVLRSSGECLTGLLGRAHCELHAGLVAALVT